MCECEIGVDFAYLVEIAAVTLKIFNERIKMQKRKKRKNRMCTRYNRMKKEEFETRKLHWYLYITEFINICNTFYSKRNEILKTITLSQEQTNVVKEIDKLRRISTFSSFAAAAATTTGVTLLFVLLF